MADKKSDALQIQQATLDVASQAVKTVLVGETEIALSAAEGDSVQAFSAPASVISATGNNSVASNTAIVPATSATGISKAQMVSLTNVALAASGLVVSLQVSPAPTGDVWFPLQTLTPASGTSSVTGTPVIDVVAQRYRVVVSYDTLDSGDFQIFVNTR